MRKNTIWLLSFFIIFFLLISPVYAQGSNQKNFLWKVQSKTGAVYILGSVHFLKKEMYPLGRKIEDSFEKSDILVVEANVNEPGQAEIQQLIASAFYPDADSLENHISAKTYELVKSAAGNAGIPLELINKQRPWFLSMTLESLELVKLGFDPNYGIDKYFLTKAAGKKKILELESLDFQIKLFSGFSDKEQELMLLYTLKDLSTIEQELDKLVRAWTSGDTKGMEAIITKSLAEDKKLLPVYEKLIYERNRNMVSKIEEYLKTEDTCFVVVGAGHLVGNKGVIEILREKGYAVEQM